MSPRAFVSSANIRRRFHQLNWPLFILILILLAYGIFVLYSATSSGVGRSSFFWQIGFIAAGIIVALIMAFSDYHIWWKLAYPLYFIAILLLVAVFFVGTEIFGAQRWIYLDSFPIQPSEIAKVALILVLAKELSNQKRKERPLLYFWRSLGLMLLPALLVFEQPDFGTSIVILFIFFILSFFASVRPLYIFSTLGAILASTPLLWSFLRSYQRNRILVLFDPSVDPLGIGYNLRQSLITIGSGGILGKGYLQGTQKQLQFLPVRHTDFIFAVLAEELGFLGVVLLLALYALLFYFCSLVALQADDDFGTLIVVGVMSMWLCHVFINIGMTTGIMPVTGIWLPFFSYGGNSTLLNLFCVGLILSVSTGRKKFMFYPER